MKDMDRREREALDRYLTTEPECEHTYISWHGSWPECQECGEAIPVADYMLADFDVGEDTQP